MTTFRIVGSVRGHYTREVIKERLEAMILSLGPAYEGVTVEVRDPYMPLEYECTGCLHTGLFSGTPDVCPHCKGTTFRLRDNTI